MFLINLLCTTLLAGSSIHIREIPLTGLYTLKCSHIVNAMHSERLEMSASKKLKLFNILLEFTLTFMFAPMFVLAFAVCSVCNVRARKCGTLSYEILRQILFHIWTFKKSLNQFYLICFSPHDFPE